MNQRLWSVTILGILSAVAVHSAGADLADVEAALIAERASIEAPLSLIPGYLLEQLDQLSTGELEQVIAKANVGSALIQKVLRRANDAKIINRDLEARGALRESGCLGASGSGYEGSFVGPDEAQIHPDELLRRTHGVVVVKVLEARSGYTSAGFATRIVAEVLENMGGDPIALEQGDELQYLQGHYSLQLGDQRLCAERRPGFDEPRAGDVVLILGAEPTGLQIPESLIPALMFPVREGVVVDQPYHILADEFSMTLDELRLELAGR